MQRRTFLQGSIAAAVAAVTSSRALAQHAAPAAAPPAASAPPEFPPIDVRSVWLVGDWVPPDPITMSTRLAALVQGRKDVMDRYQDGGAVAELEQAFARLLGKEDCAFFASGTLANNVAVRVLCGEHRRALVDKYIEGLSVPEMATRDGKGTKATESTLHRARLAFARVFELLAKRRGGIR